MQLSMSQDKKKKKETCSAGRSFKNISHCTSIVVRLFCSNQTMNITIDVIYIALTMCHTLH